MTDPVQVDADVLQRLADSLGRVWALYYRWDNATELGNGNPSIVTKAFAAELRKALDGD